MKILILISAVFIMGCTTAPKVYNPNNIRAEDLAFIETSLEPSLLNNNSEKTWIELIWDEDGNEITGRREHSMWDEMVSEISLPAGTYKFKVSCSNTGLTSRLDGVFTFEAKKKYEMYCDLVKGKNMFGILVNKSLILKIRDNQSLIEQIKNLKNQANKAL